MTRRALPLVRTDASAAQLWRELTIGLAVFGVYIAVSRGWPARLATAVAHSRWIFDVERALHLDVELALNRWLARQGTLRVAANYEYAITYVITAFGLLAWLYLRRPEAYRWARTSFILVNLIGVTCFAAYPVAPPRLVADLGFMDTVLLGRTHGTWGSKMLSHANQLAAMPSLHFAWTVWVSLVLRSGTVHPVAQWLSGVHVLVSLLVIMATANHYLLDAVAGAVLAVACVALVRPRGCTGPLGRVRTWFARSNARGAARSGERVAASGELWRAVVASMGDYGGDLCGAARRGRGGSRLLLDLQWTS